MRKPRASDDSFVTCPCGNAERFIDSVDITGTAYVICKVCGRLTMLSRDGWVDHATGLFVQDDRVFGSAVTKSIATGLIVRHW